jgi:hypothetical protein
MFFKYFKSFAMNWKLYELYNQKRKKRLSCSGSLLLITSLQSQTDYIGQKITIADSTTLLTITDLVTFTIWSLKQNDNIIIDHIKWIPFFSFSGIVAERVNLRYFLSLGMIFSGVFTFLFGLAKYTEIHGIAYFIVIQVKLVF